MLSQNGCIVNLSFVLPAGKGGYDIMKKRISVTQETSTGRNTKFHDNVTGNNMTRAGFVRQIKSGTYDDYYVRNINGIPTPCSKPDGNKGNNLD